MASASARVEALDVIAAVGVVAFVAEEMFVVTGVWEVEAGRMAFWLLFSLATVMGSEGP